MFFIILHLKCFVLIFSYIFLDTKDVKNNFIYFIHKLIIIILLHSNDIYSCILYIVVTMNTNKKKNPTMTMYIILCIYWLLIIIITHFYESQIIQRIYNILFFKLVIFFYINFLFWFYRLFHIPMCHKHAFKL